MSITVLEASKAYLESLQAKGKHKRTLYTYGKDLEQVCAFFGADKPLDAITLPQVGKFLKSDALLRRSKGQERAQQTVTKTLRVFRMFLVWAKEHGYIETLPLTKDIPIGRSPV